MQRSLVEIDLEVVFRLRIFDVPVHVYNTWRLLENIFYLRSELDLASVVRTVDFCDKRLQHRRARRNFRHFDAGAERGREFDKFRAQAPRYLMTLSLTIMPRQQVHLNVRLIRLTAQKIMPHHAIEVIRTRCARINLVIRHFGLLRKILSQGLRDASGLLERRSVGHIDDDLELALVVEGQHLYANPFQRDERNCCQEEDDYAAKKNPASLGVENQRVHDVAIKTRSPALGFVMMVAAIARVVPQESQRGPRGHDKGNDQREHHRR